MVATISHAGCSTAHFLEVRGTVVATTTINILQYSIINCYCYVDRTIAIVLLGKVSTIQLQYIVLPHLWYVRLRTTTAVLVATTP